ncbi:MAG: glycosyltransferase family 4 protein [Bacteroidetes bacterium]|nr:glycosyltransferase family 4 protein [Bacteroidota bacterium]
MKPKVLMLGWEFPPVINGGLGVASLGLAQALAKDTDLTMIIPRSDPQFSLPGLELIGADSIKLKDLFQNGKEFESSLLETVHLEYVDVPLAGYEAPTLRVVQREVATETLTIERQTPVDTPVLPLTFALDELYGDDLMRRIREFTTIVSRLAMEKEFDLIHAHDWMTFLAGLEIKAWSGKPLVVHVHSLEYDRSGPESRGFAWHLEKHAFEQADLVIPVSEYTGKIIEEKYEISPEKIFPVHNGIESIQYDRKPRPFPQKLVTFLGRITEQKAPETFLEVAWKVMEKYNQVRFVMAGEGNLLGEMMEKVARLKLGDRIHFTGFLSREETRELLAMTDVLVMPSVSEPFGLVALEAAMMGVGCVISRQSGVSEVMPDALIADHWDVEKMAEYTLALLEYPDMGKDLIDITQKDISKITWEFAARNVMLGYQKIL